MLGLTELLNLSESLNLNVLAAWTTMSNELLTINISFVKDENTLNFSNLFIYDLIVNFILIFFFLFGIIYYLLTSGLKSISYGNGSLSNFWLFNYFADFEEDIGNIDDALSFSVIFIAFVSWFFFLSLFFNTFFQSINWLLSLFIFIIFPAIVTPFFLLKSFGINFLAYVRGAGRSSNIIVEVLLDAISILVMVARFLIQNVRLFLVFATFIELLEFVYDTCDSNLTTLGDIFLVNYSSSSTFWYDLLSDFIIQQIMLLYYQIHFMAVFIAQLTNYVILSVGLFFFLYSTFMLEPMEKYFLHKRAL